MHGGRVKGTQVKSTQVTAGLCYSKSSPRICVRFLWEVIAGSTRGVGNEDKGGTRTTKAGYCCGQLLGSLCKTGEHTSELSRRHGGQEARASVHSPSLSGWGLAGGVNTLGLAVCPAHQQSTLLQPENILQHEQEDCGR